jgi:hypothetical protein
MGFAWKGFATEQIQIVYLNGKECTALFWLAYFSTYSHCGYMADIGLTKPSDFKLKSTILSRSAKYWKKLIL